MFGLRVRDEQGQIILDSGDFTYEVIYNEVLDWSAVNSTIETTITIEGFDPSTCVFCTFLEYPGNYNPTAGNTSYPGMPYVYPVTGNQITLRSSTPGNTSGIAFATGVFRLIAFRML